MEHGLDAVMRNPVTQIVFWSIWLGVGIPCAIYRVVRYVKNGYYVQATIGSNNRIEEMVFFGAAVLGLIFSGPFAIFCISDD